MLCSIKGMPPVDASCENDLLESNEKVYGLIYEISNNVTGQKYIGQTASHRKNKAKWRPFGMIGRFNDHISEALNNTKRKQCSYLNNAIRKYGRECFSVCLVQVCEVSQLDDLEKRYIAERNTLYPNGYNLTKGGKSTYVECKLDSTSLCEKKTHGGCVSRSKETRAKMSKRAKEAITDKFRLLRSESASRQHLAGKLDRFKGVKIDLTKIDSYIRKKGDAVVVKIGDATASFRSSKDSHEVKNEKAKAFVKMVHDATLSNCGEPVKPE